MKNHNTKVDYTPIQLKLPVDLQRIIKINNPVYTFSEVMAYIDLQKYFVERKGHETGRPRYDREKLLKIVLLAFMEFGYCSVRFIQQLCETDIRFIWMLDEENAPSHMTISNSIQKELSWSLQNIFNDIKPKKLRTSLRRVWCAHFCQRMFFTGAEMPLNVTEDPFPGILRFSQAVFTASIVKQRKSRKP